MKPPVLSVLTGVRDMLVARCKKLQAQTDCDAGLEVLSFGMLATILDDAAGEIERQALEIARLKGEMV